MLIVTLLITGVGSIFNALVTSYWEFAPARFITGIGVGADLAIVNSYINEVAPKNGRAKYTSFLFVLAGIGVVISSLGRPHTDHGSGNVSERSSVCACSNRVFGHQRLETYVRYRRRSCACRCLT